MAVVTGFDLESQAQDTVYLNRGTGRSSRVTGKIIEFMPGFVVVQSGNKRNELAESTIRKIQFGAEPSQLSRARDRMEDGRYDDCLATLEKIEDAPKSQLIQHEIDYLKAYSNAQIALRGGEVTAKSAGGGINTFVRTYGDSYKIYDAREVLGKLLLAVGKADLAELEFAKLAKSPAVEDQLSGLFNQGQTQLMLDKFEAAKASFETILAIDSNDEVTQQMQTVARCQLLRIQGMTGDTAAALAEIQAIVKKENSTNEQLFAHLYNAMGACHEKMGDNKKAAISFLKTQLLFKSQADAHAEALYRLSVLWPKLKDTERANSARTIIKTSYRNSYWATKL